MSKFNPVTVVPKRNGSVVDWLTSNGVDSSFANRKYLFEKLFGEKYRGTAKQNGLLLKEFHKVGNRPTPSQVVPPPAPPQVEQPMPTPTIINQPLQTATPSIAATPLVDEMSMDAPADAQQGTLSPTAQAILNYTGSVPYSKSVQPTFTQMINEWKRENRNNPNLRYEVNTLMPVISEWGRDGG